MLFNEGILILTNLLDPIVDDPEIHKHDDVTNAGTP